MFDAQKSVNGLFTSEEFQSWKQRGYIISTLQDLFASGYGQSGRVNF